MLAIAVIAAAVDAGGGVMLAIAVIAAAVDAGGGVMLAIAVDVGDRTNWIS